MSEKSPAQIASVHGLTAHVDAAVLAGESADLRQIIFLSLIGSSVSVTGIWAGLISGEDVHVAGQSCERWARQDGKLPSYRIFRRPLPRFGKVHTIMTTEDAIPSLAAIGRDFFVVSRDDESADARLARFKTAWDRAVTVPALDAWSSELVRYGLAAELVKNVETIGSCRAARVIADNARWSEVVRRIARDNRRKQLKRIEKVTPSIERRVTLRRKPVTARPASSHIAATKLNRRTAEQRRSS